MVVVLPAPFGPGVGCTAALVLDELDGDNHPALPHLAHMRMIFEFARPAAEVGGADPASSSGEEHRLAIEAHVGLPPLVSAA